MASSPDKKESAARPRGSGAQIVYEALRQSILEMALDPGSPLDEVSLSEEFGMSRTPVREALVRLASDGLVTTLPNRNTIVAPIDFTQLPVYFEALTLMYRVTTRSAAIHHRQEDLIAIRSQQAAFAEAVRRRDALGMIGANRDFHVAIAEAGGNPYFTGLFTRLLDEGRRLLRLYYSSFEDRLPRQYLNEHEAMVEAIAAREGDLCERLGAMHADQIVRQIKSYLDRNTVSGIRIGDR